MHHISKEQLLQDTRFHRANIVNCLLGPKPAMLCGTRGTNGISNIALFSNVFHVGADPAIIGYVQRPVGESGHTYQNILDTKVYTLNLAHPDILTKAHYTSARFKPEVSEFEACQLTEKNIDNFAAPFITECAVQIGLQLLEAIPITHNNTTIVLGTVEHIFIADDLLQSDGNIRFTKQTGLSAVGLEQYYSIELLQQMPYAKVEQLPNF